VVEGSGQGKPGATLIVHGTFDVVDRRAIVVDLAKMQVGKLVAVGVGGTHRQAVCPCAPRPLTC